jgi:putative ABC transport system permease protein
MKLVHHIHEGVANLMASRLRSILALLGILVGTASVVAMVSGGELATNEALKQFKTLGTDLLACSVSDSSDTSRSSGTLNNLTLPQALNVIQSDHHIEDLAPY